jgi:hypothetical protein
VFEETGLKLNPKDLWEINKKQGIATLSIHKVNLFNYPLSGNEIQYILDTKDQVRGIEADSERTTAILKTVRECMQDNLVDYATLGMIVDALAHKVH